jgi:hypothetical protein
MAGQWWAEDMVSALTAVSGIYGVALLPGAAEEVFLRRIAVHPPSRFSLDEGDVVGRAVHGAAISFALQEPRIDKLELLRVSYSSPGFADVVGLGTAVEHVKDFVLRLIELRQSRESRDQDLIQKRFENMHRLLDLLDRTKADPFHRTLVLSFLSDQEAPLFRLVSHGLITKVSVIDLPDGPSHAAEA